MSSTLSFHLRFHTNTQVHQKGRISIRSIATIATAESRSLRQLVQVSSFSFLGFQSLSLEPPGLNLSRLTALLSARYVHMVPVQVFFTIMKHSPSGLPITFLVSAVMQSSMAQFLNLWVVTLWGHGSLRALENTAIYITIHNGSKLTVKK